MCSSGINNARKILAKYYDLPEPAIMILIGVGSYVMNRCLGA